MTRDFSKLAGQPFDLLVIGGGIVGAGIAWDASLRGLSCALVEANDFASGTSSKTTKLIHGGIRYLEQLDFHLVRESLRERGFLLSMAPQVVHPLSFLIPIRKNRPRPGWMIHLGLFLYDRLAGRGSIGRHRFLQGKQLEQEEPRIFQNGYAQAARYYDAQMDDARLVIEVLKAASRSGAQLCNYSRVVGFRKEGNRVVGAEVEDLLSLRRGTIRANQIINATGPWADHLRRMADPSVKPLVRMSKGIHLVYPDLGLKEALLISSQRDGRIFFLIPWRELTLIGTTDADYTGDPGQARAEADDVAYLLQEANRALPGFALQKGKVLSTFAGIRPLIAQEAKDPWAVSRSHRIYEDPDGLLTVVGGKFTTFRKIAEDAVNRISKAPCRTAEQRLPAGWSPSRPFTAADVRYAVEEEMACSISDLFWRRFSIGHSPCPGLDALDWAAAVMGQILGWDAAEVRRQIDRYQEEVAATRRF